MRCSVIFTFFFLIFWIFTFFTMGSLCIPEKQIGPSAVSCPYPATVNNPLKKMHPGFSLQPKSAKLQLQTLKSTIVCLILILNLSDNPVNLACCSYSPLWYMPWPGSFKLLACWWTLCKSPHFRNWWPMRCWIPLRTMSCIAMFSRYLKRLLKG